MMKTEETAATAADTTTTTTTTAPEDLRVLLWDIDGTLLRSLRVGAFKDYTIPVLQSIFGTAGRIHDMRVSGMTDLQIIGEALSDEGITHDDIPSGTSRKSHALYSRWIASGPSARAETVHLSIPPGVLKILARVAVHPRYRSSLPGNLEPAAL